MGRGREVDVVRVIAFVLGWLAGCGGAGGAEPTEGATTAGAERAPGDEGSAATGADAPVGADTQGMGANEASGGTGSGATAGSVEGGDAAAGASGGATQTATTPSPGTGGAEAAGADWNERVARGRRAFQRRCDSCHPGGDEDVGPRIIGKNWTAERMRAQVRRGSGRMRPIPPSRLSDADLEDLLAYLTTLRAIRGLGPQAGS
ncbi:MAG: cytochrome c [Myxococcales bacterium]|nr:cytochrome c [Myxococcales bacterium]